MQKWGTYCGGAGTERAIFGFLDNHENLFITGFTTSPSGISTTGSHQANLGGNSDAFLLKFGTNGQRIWGTYLGGTQEDRGICCSYDPSGIIYVSGYMNSSGLGTSGSFQDQKNTAFLSDGFLAKFDTAGTLDWFTYYGGNGQDIARSCMLDDSMNVDLVGFTAMGLDSTSTTGVHQPTYGGSQDAFWAKFKKDGTRLSATYYGGNQTEYGMFGKASGNSFYLLGSSLSQSAISTPGSHQSVNGGTEDAFLIKFRESCLFYHAVDTVSYCDSLVSHTGRHVWRQSGFYQDTLVMSNGCDTIYSYQLTINNSRVLSDTVTICHGQIYTFPDGDTSSVPSIDSSLFQVKGCDSLIITHLMVNYPVEIFLGASICQGKTYTFIDGDTSSQSSIDTSIVPGLICDTIYYTNLEVNSPKLIKDSKTICQGSIFTFPDGDTSSIPQIHLSLLKTASGCDSIVETQLSISPTYNRNDTIDLCGKSTHTLPDGRTVNSSGNYTSRLTSILGCDSVVITKLSFNEPSSQHQKAVICPGEVFVFPDGDTSTVSHIDTSYFLSHKQCDSLIITELKVEAIDTSVITSGNNLRAGDTSATQYQWINCETGAIIPQFTGPTFTPPNNGSYAMIIFQNECQDSSSCYAFETVGLKSLQRNNDVIIYPNPTHQNLTLELDQVVSELVVTVYNPIGQEVFRKTYRHKKELNLELKGSNGVYWLNLEAEGIHQRFKVIKQ
ncbi:T9SS type A sorting domain-containing protein [bacterium SCSIO 12741]|nr:T9SS type A sorting domain-containing protein [bacterium SCSIO 12741]